jgi:hypothetical protein
MDSLAPFVSGRPAGPRAESFAHLPGTPSIWVCPSAKPNTYAPFVYLHLLQYPKGGMRTNYSHTCGNAVTDLNSSRHYQPAPNYAGLVMADGYGAGGAAYGYDTYGMCNRYHRMPPESVLLFCGCYGSWCDGGLPETWTCPENWNWDATNSRQQDPANGIYVIVPFAHLDHNPALTVNGSVKSYSRGSRMGDGSDTWMPIGF